MKSRNKIFVVIGMFVGFYFALIPLNSTCMFSSEICSVFRELILITRPVVASEFWGMEMGIVQWSGTPEGIVAPTFTEILSWNIQFILSMIVFPLGIIIGIVIWDNRK